MKKILLALVAVALAGPMAPATTEAQTNPEFRRQLLERIGNAIGSRAANRIRAVLNRAVLRTPTRVIPFVRITNATLRRITPNNQRGRVAQTILTTAMRAYFRRSGELNRFFQAPNRIVLRSLPGSQKTRPLANRISRQLVRFYQQFNPDATAVEFDTITNTTFTNLGFPPPVPPVS